ncbi:hypothetical protein BUALT_Bualt01G0177200 [Buddleja alternifolia]|uniref:TF-B3 domain-containing protein n=1 Tax=Buddleja alternifolia TaxID=168488 RepID=A0AAV6YEH1_9LAMI|nr:hypothetical protein BUALT_Bualt01G0177200 [Buddleja alternifolia]
MSNPSQRSSRFAAIKKEVFSKPYAPVKKEMIEVDELLQQSKEHLHKSEPVENSESEDDVDIRHLSGKPFFDVVLAQSHVYPSCQLHLPVKIVKELPKATVPVVLSHGGKNWNMSYVGTCPGQRFDTRWKKFVIDNHLQEGDALVFELMECSKTKIKFKVHILRGDLPHELQMAIDSSGSVDNPITIE